MTKRQRQEQRQVIERLRRDARELARHFALPLRSVDAERPQVKRRYGICYEDGSIRIRLRNLRTGELLRYSGLVDTLCHELAHLRHFDHGPRFHALYRRILERARECGIYRPRARGLVPALAARRDVPMRDPGRGHAPPPGRRHGPPRGHVAPARAARKPVQLTLFAPE